MVEDRTSLIEFANEIRTLIRHENELTNNRLVWLLTFQSLLFAGISFADKAGEAPIQIAIPIVGLVTAVPFAYSLILSSEARTHLRELWQEKMRNYPEMTKNMAPIDGSVPYARRISWLNPWSFVPWVLVVAWVVYIILTLVNSQ